MHANLVMPCDRPKRIKWIVSCRLDVAEIKCCSLHTNFAPSNQVDDCTASRQDICYEIRAPKLCSTQIAIDEVSELWTTNVDCQNVSLLFEAKWVHLWLYNYYYYYLVLVVKWNTGNLCVNRLRWVESWEWNVLIKIYADI